MERLRFAVGKYKIIFAVSQWSLSVLLPDVNSGRYLQYF